MNALPDLPIVEALPRLRQGLTAQGTAILSAPPGSGKTTLVPLALLDEPWLQGRSILMLEPRRLAARLAAARMAQLLGEPLGATVGYRIRHEQVISPATRIEVLTEGILTRRLQQDPALEGTGLLIFDEFHERHLQSDLALALALDCAGGLRDDLRLLIMSASLDLAGLGAFLPEALTVRAEGRAHPVTIDYLRRETDAPPLALAQSGVLRALAERPGDILAFLPGTGEIRRLAERLRGQVGDGCLVLPLFADLSREQQDLALRPDPGGRRRVVLATSVAETSLTIEGIATVVDLGLARRPRFDANSGLGRLETRRCSKAAALQRAGRAGRLGPGHCYRLWTEARHQSLAEAERPEMLDADLSQLVLETALWGAPEVSALRWLDPPPDAAVAQACALLRQLGLLDAQGRATRLGAAASALGVHPRLGALLLAADRWGCRPQAAELAALLSERDILSGPERPTDLELRLDLLRQWRAGGAAPAGVDGAACRQVDRLARRLGGRAGPGDGSGRALAGLLLAAYPDRLAARAGDDPRRYRLAFGGALRLPEGDRLQSSPFLVVPELDAGQREGRIFIAAAISRGEIEELLADRLETRAEVAWVQDRVLAREQVRYGNLVLAERPLANPDPESVRQALLRGIRARGLEVLPWTREARELQARLLSLRAWQPDQGWPDLSEASLTATLEQWLAPWLEGVSRLDQLPRLELVPIFQALLDWPRGQALERDAPSHLLVPSGARRQLAYQQGEPPVLAVRLQELFGLQETPSVCQGRVKVLLHLLSPARRPIQVTQDLRGFWERTYPEVKKELKGRYPKHYWPEDPFAAVPTHRVRPPSR